MTSKTESKPKIEPGQEYQLSSNKPMPNNADVPRLTIISIGGKQRTFKAKFTHSIVFTDKPFSLSVRKTSVNKEEINLNNFTNTYSFKKSYSEGSKDRYITFSFSSNDLIKKTSKVKIPDKNITNFNTTMTSNKYFNTWLDSKKSTLKPNSIKNYQNQFLYLNRILFNNPKMSFITLPSGIDYLKDANKIITKFKSVKLDKLDKDGNKKEIPIRTLKIYLSIIQQMMKYHGFEETYRHYNNEILELNTKLDQQAINQTMTKTQEDRWVDWVKLLDDYNKIQHNFNSNNILENVKYMILSLLVLFPVRRISDLRLLRLNRSGIPIESELVKGNPNKYQLTRDYGLDRRYNYVNIDDNDDIQLVFLNYKTSKLYGDQVFNLKDLVTVSPKLSNLLYNYIDAQNIDDGGFLFQKPNKSEVDYQEPYKQTDMTSFIIRYTQKVFGKPINASLFRTSYITHYKMTKNPDNREEHQTSQMLANSASEQRDSYFKKYPLLSAQPL